MRTLIIAVGLAAVLTAPAFGDATRRAASCCVCSGDCGVSRQCTDVYGISDCADVCATQGSACVVDRFKRAKTCATGCAGNTYAPAKGKVKR